VRHADGIERLAVERLAGLARLDAGAARPRAGIEASRPSAPPALVRAHRHGTSSGTSPASSASQWNASPGLPRLILHRTARHDPSVLRD
jgi:hypothetical protein